MKRFDKIIVCSQWVAASMKPTASDALISIRDPIDTYHLTEWIFNPQHRSRFMDVGAGGGACMTKSHAELIWKFIRWLPPAVKRLVIHCTMGMSRSPSVAMAICDKLGLGRAVIDWNDDVFKDAPNQHVYKTMMEAA